MDTLRKVTYKDHGQHTHKYRDEANGLFHRWGQVSSTIYDGFITVAIVEDIDTGQITTCEPSDIKFVSDHDKA